jgi:hypothetical protein
MELAAVQQEYLYRYFRYFPPKSVGGQEQPGAYSSSNIDARNKNELANGVMERIAGHTLPTSLDARYYYSCLAVGAQHAAPLP